MCWDQYSELRHMRTTGVHLSQALCDVEKSLSLRGSNVWLLDECRDLVGQAPVTAQPRYLAWLLEMTKAYCTEADFTEFVDTCANKNSSAGLAAVQYLLDQDKETATQEKVTVASACLQAVQLCRFKAEDRIRHLRRLISLRQLAVAARAAESGYLESPP